MFLQTPSGIFPERHPHVVKRTGNFPSGVGLKFRVFGGLGADSLRGTFHCWRTRESVYELFLEIQGNSNPTLTGIYSHMRALTGPVSAR